MNQRLAYLDNLKVVLVVGVIAVHTAITYGLDGSWYLESYDEMADGVVAAVAVVLGIGWLFGLGLFFLIAGRLSAPSLERKGPRQFARDRLVRLGIPLVGYTLLISPFLESPTRSPSRSPIAAPAISSRSPSRAGTRCARSITPSPSPLEPDMLTPKVTPIHHKGPSPYAPLVPALTARK